jgi:hypothetical protein
MYAMMGTRPDIAYSLSILSRFLHSPLKIHYDLAICVLKYLKQTKEKCISYKRLSNNTNIIGFTDSDWAGCTETRKSMTGYVFFLAGGPISWKSARQTRTTLSSQQAEYYALSEGCREAKWFYQLTKEIGYPMSLIINLDSTTAKTLALNPISGGRSKHFDIQYHWIREIVALKEVSLEYVNTHLNISDIFTKPLHLPTFSFLCEALFNFDMSWFSVKVNPHRYNRPLEVLSDDEDDI